jgi:hypothetical protein
VERLFGEEALNIKICILGENTSMIQDIGRLISDRVFEADYISIQGVDICTKKIIVKDQDINVILTIIPKNERFEKIRASFYHGAKGFLVFFDKSDIESFEAVPHWIRNFQENIKINTIGSIVGINTEIEEITYEQGQRLANQLYCEYGEITPTSKNLLITILQSLIERIILLY